MTLSQRATITAHYTPAIEAAETRLDDAGSADGTEHRRP